MASINTKQRVSATGAVTYQVQVRGKGVSKPYSKTFSDQVEAEKWTKEQDEKINQSADSHSEPVSNRHSIAALNDEFMLNTMFKGGKPKRSYETIQSRMKVIARGFGNQPVNTITADDVRRYTIKRLSTKAKSRTGNVSGSTIRKELELNRHG